MYLLHMREGDDIEEDGNAKNRTKGIGNREKRQSIVHRAGLAVNHKTKMPANVP
jgi:hypothetical protein